MTKALTTVDSFPLAGLRDANATANLVYYFGVSQLPQVVNLPDDTTEAIPQRNFEEDDHGVLTYLEPEHEYIKRVWPELSGYVKSHAIVSGLKKAATYKEALSDGIQLVCYRAYLNGWWVATHQDAIMDEAEFRAWVKDAVTAEDGSSTEATQLASTILNLYWLKANGYDGLPVDLEEIFLDRSTYSRWRRKASELRGLIQSIEDLEPEDDDLEDEIQDDIQQAIDDINDLGKSTSELDQPVASTKAPRLIILLCGRDELGREAFEGAATPTQMSLLRSNTRRLTEFRLKGEEYGITESHVLAEYKQSVTYACPECGISYARPGDSCSVCKAEEELVSMETWDRRTWDTKDGWSAFEDHAEPDMNGNQEGVPLHDPDLGVTYMRQWEEVE